MFRYNTGRLRDKKLLKIGNAPNDIINKHLTAKCTCTLHTLNTHPRGPNFTPFCSLTSHFQDTFRSKTCLHSTTNRFRDTRFRKSEMHRMTPE